MSQVPVQSKATENSTEIYKGIVIRNLEELLHFSKIVAASGILPDNLGKDPNRIAVVLECGMEVGLKAMQSLLNMYVIGGRPCLYAETMLSIAMSHPFFDMGVFKEWLTGKIDDGTRTAHCRVKRVGMREPVERQFSLADARRAGLLNRQSWQQYPDRMLIARARSYALRDCFPDVFKGIRAVEEIEYSDSKQEVREEATSVLVATASALAEAPPAEDSAHQQPTGQVSQRAQRLMAMLESKLTE